jgi:Ca-activated chloride channel family protein
MTDDKMTDDALYSLKSLRSVQPSPEAKKLALNAAMAAFDVEHQRKPAAKASWFSNWKLGAGLGVPVGTAIAALVLLPLGTQLYTATSSRPEIAMPPKVGDVTTIPDVTIASTDALKKADDADAKTKAPVAVANTTPATGQPQDESGRTTTVTEKPQGPVLAQLDEDREIAMPTEEAAPEVDQLAVAQPPAPEPLLGGEAALAPKMAAAPNSIASGTVAGGLYDQPTSIVPMTQGDTFQKFDENKVKVTAKEPVSTFSIDVDTASYSYVRGLLKDGYLPDPDAVRLEEMINYFPYDYAVPTSLDTPFKASMAVIPTPWNAKTQLLEIGIKGYVPPATARQPENLTFLIDTSGSMDEPNKLPLLKRSFGLLVDTLLPNDTVSIVTYAGSAGIALKPTKAKDKTTILQSLDQMYADGSTAGAEGIALAYKVNEEAKGDGTVNRVILATDGDFNVGIDDPDQLKAYIKTQRDQGIFLSVLGFGRGNLDDALMQSLAQNGNGNASYIDTFQEAQKVLVEEGGANMITIAKDVKIQVEFNPALVSEYRLIGYETRALNNEDFNNDTVDAGEIGAGHTVTAIYEITPAGTGADLNDPLRYQTTPTTTGAVSDELGFLKIRYKAPEGDVSKLITTPIGKDLVVNEFDKATDDQRFAATVAAFAQKLKGSNYGETLTWDQISTMANAARGVDANGYRGEFVQLVKLAALLNPDHLGGGKSKFDDPNHNRSGTPRATGGKPTGTPPLAVPAN